MDKSDYTAEFVKSKMPFFFAVAKRARSMDALRERLAELALQMEFDTMFDYREFDEGSIIRVRDCAHAFRSIIKKRSDDLSGFSVARALRDVAHNKARPDLTPAFWADVYHILMGLSGEGKGRSPDDQYLATTALSGREAAIKRSEDLDRLWAEKVQPRLDKFVSGLMEESVHRREARKEFLQEKLGATEEDWRDHRWQLKNIRRELAHLEGLVKLTDGEKEAIFAARENKLPFGVTPYYLSLMDDEPSDRDRAIRAQVFPPMSYVKRMKKAREAGEQSLDFMLESDTSPIDLITRRYPGIAIFKPFNACPQICVYCQRNWEIDGPMDPAALAPPEKIDAAIKWIEEHGALHEILVTGGDPLAMSTKRLGSILKRLAKIDSVRFIRIGSRTPVTVPMRIDDELADLLGSLSVPGRRKLDLVTHIQHCYEVTPDTVEAVARLRARGVAIYNQHVYTFYSSRRFENAALRDALRLTGINPYYTFHTKGKEETYDYWVPLARLLQEQKEEARLLPGLSRQDEAVFNVPGLGKNYLRAAQHRDLISIMPNGSRVYEFHPWEKNISEEAHSYVGHDMPVLEYLERIEKVGEDPAEYATIWYYY